MGVLIENNLSEDTLAPRGARNVAMTAFQIDEYVRI